MVREGIQAACLACLAGIEVAPGHGMETRATTCSLLGPILWLGALAAAPPASASDWPQFNRDSLHSGANLEESTIHAGNVGSLQVRYHVALPGLVDAAPVFLAGVATPQGVKDLLFMTSLRGIVMAVDAATGTVVWSRRPARRPGTTTASPAVDPNRRFVYAYGLDGKAHKFAVGDGGEITTGGWPQVVTLKPSLEQGSSDLAVATAANGVAHLYVASSGYPGAAGDAQGHVTAIDLGSGAQQVFNAACSDQAVHFTAGGSPDCGQTQSGVWARAGVVYDPALDRILFATGAGAFDADRGGHDWGDSVLALRPDGTGSGGGSPVDSYTPNDFQMLQDLGDDLGSSAPAILPAPPASKIAHLAVQAGKEGELHLISLDDMSRQGGPGHTAGEVEPVGVPQGGPVLTQPAVWVEPQAGNTWMFTANDQGISAMQLFVDAAGNPTIFSQWSRGGRGGSSPVVANGILYYAGPDGLHALDPVSGSPLFADTRIGGIHWQSPIVVDGRLYVADQAGTLWAYEPAPATPAFHALASPCRLIDTRGSDGVYGGPALSGGVTRTFAAAGQCGLPAGTLAIAAVITAEQATARGFLQVGPANVTLVGPTMRFRPGAARTLQTQVSLTGNPVGSLSVTARGPGTVDLVLDVTGYYQ